jgi:pentatricopeptide repeat protein
MGEVYRARDPQLEREVALKVLPAETLADENARARMMREARMAAKLNHPHVCTVHEVGEADGQVYIAMELVEGQPLDTILAGGPLPVEQAVRLGMQVAEALAHAHERGVVHRDLKSANVVITPEGRAKVLDFGLAKQLVGEELAEATTELGATLTVPGSVVGTVAYMAPEQLRGQATDARSDVWALGIVLYEMLGGRRPFAGQTGYDLSSAILNEPPPPLPNDVPAAVRDVVDCCLAKDAGQRFQTADEVHTALETASIGGVVTFPAPRSTVAPRRRWWLAGAAAAVITFGLLTAAALKFNWVGHVSGTAPVQSLAVLPLENLSGDPEQDYLADGVHEALITDLAKLSGLRRVIARSSVMRYRYSETPLSQIARELGVDALVTGSVLRAGDRIQVTAHLIQASTENQLWADRYERQFRDVLSLGNDVVAAITRAIRLQLTPQEQERLATTRTVDPDTYEAYVKGMYYLYKKTPAGFERGLALLEHAIDDDPSEPLPYAGLALAYPIIYHGPGGTVPPMEGFPRAREAALEALELDDGSAQAHLALAAIKTYHDWDWGGAEREFLRALELNPNLVEAHAHYGWYLHLFNRNEEALAELRKAQELDPLTPIYTAWVAWLCLNLGDLENAAMEADKALDIDPNQPDALLVLSSVHAGSGEFEEAIAIGQRLAAVNLDWRFVLAQAYARAGRTDEALQLVTDMEREDYPKFGIWISGIQTVLGNKNEALRALEKAFDFRHIFLPWKMRDSPWRDDPRWQEMHGRLNYPEN